jgi:hypothetical protein
VSSAENLDRKVLAAAYLQAQTLLNGAEPLAVDEAQRLEATLRPLAAAPEIKQLIVPLLDRAGLYSLAMAWDSGAEERPIGWLAARAERFVKLTAPEFALLVLCELQRQNSALPDVKEKALGALESERGVRKPMLEQNLEVIAENDAELAEELRRTHRTTVAMRPAGQGLAEFAGPGQSWVQLWAISADAARADAARLVEKCCSYEDSFIAGVGDCSLPEAAARLGRAGQRIHIVDLHASRIRALLEIVDLRAAVGEQRVLLHVGTRALRTLAPYAPQALVHDDAVVGGDPVSVSLLRAAAQSA